jgi:agmatinase
MTTSPSSLTTFDPSGVGLDNGNLYGLPCTYEEASILVFGMPWEATVSYHEGTAQGPQRILEASPQLDLYDLDNPEGWRQGIFMPPIPQHLSQINSQTREVAQRVIQATEKGIDIASQPLLQDALYQVNHACEQMNGWLYGQTCQALDQGKRVGVIGGDHSVPLGYLRALAERHHEFGILHIDAHADLRQAYQGFRYSHASIMYNALALSQIRQFVQVGIRDVCRDEVALIDQSQGRIVTYYDATLKDNRYQGMTWQEQCETMVAHLPSQVYVSFDVDGLDPKLCPHTGTPVPGGLELAEVFYLLRQVVGSGRQIIGFDLSETGDGEWDGNVGARIVYKLCCLMGLR